MFSFSGSNPGNKVFHYRGPHTIPFLFSGSEHCPLQMPPNGFLVSQITTSQWTKTQKMQVFLRVLICMCSFLNHEMICFYRPSYLKTQILFIFSKGKHLDLKALEVRGMLNPGISPHWMEDHMVWVCVWTAGQFKRRKIQSPPHPCFSMKEKFMLIRKHQLERYPFMIRSHLGWDILSSSNVAQQFSSSSDTLFVALMSSTSKYSGCWRQFMMGESSSL